MQFTTVFFIAAALAQSTATGGTSTMTSTATGTGTAKKTSTPSPNAVLKSGPSASIALLSAVLGAAFL